MIPRAPFQRASVKLVPRQKPILVSLSRPPDSGLESAGQKEAPPKRGQVAPIKPATRFRAEGVVHPSVEKWTTCTFEHRRVTGRLSEMVNNDARQRRNGSRIPAPYPTTITGADESSSRCSAEQRRRGRLRRG